MITRADRLINELINEVINEWHCIRDIKQCHPPPVIGRQTFYNTNTQQRSRCPVALSIRIPPPPFFPFPLPSFSLPLSFCPFPLPLSFPSPLSFLTLSLPFLSFSTHLRFLVHFFSFVYWFAVLAALLALYFLPNLLISVSICLPQNSRPFMGVKDGRGGAEGPNGG